MNVDETLSAGSDSHGSSVFAAEFHVQSWPPSQATNQPFKQLGQPRQQSGQCTIKEIYKYAKLYQQQNGSIRMIWAPAGAEGFALGAMAKMAARKSTKEGAIREEELVRQPQSTREKIALAGLQ
jgi:hypothetical protein